MKQSTNSRSLGAAQWNGLTRDGIVVGDDVTEISVATVTMVTTTQ